MSILCANKEKYYRLKNVTLQLFVDFDFRSKMVSTTIEFRSELLRMFFQSLSWLLLLPSAPPRPPPCQTVDYTTFYTCVKELSGVCVPARVENVLQVTHA